MPLPNFPDPFQEDQGQQEAPNLPAPQINFIPADIQITPLPKQAAVVSPYVKPTSVEPIPGEITPLGATEQFISADIPITPFKGAEVTSGISPVEQFTESFVGPNTMIGGFLDAVKGAYKGTSEGVKEIGQGNVMAGISKMAWGDAPPLVQKGSKLEKIIQTIVPDFIATGTPVTRQAFKESAGMMLGKPIVNTAQFIDKKESPFLKAIVETAEGFTTPENILIMGVTGGLGMLESAAARSVAGKLISTGFAADMVVNAYKHNKAFQEAINNGDEAEAEYQLTHALLSGSMGALAGAHATTGQGATLIEPRDIRAARAITETGKKVVGAVTSPVTKMVTKTAESLTGPTGTFRELVRKTSEPSKTKAQAYEEKLTQAEPQLREIARENPDVSTPKEFQEAIQKRIDQFDADLLETAARTTGDGPEPRPESIVVGAADEVRTAIEKRFKELGEPYTAEQMEKAKFDVIDRLEKPGGVEWLKRDPSILELEGLRKKLGEEVAPIYGSEGAQSTPIREAKDAAVQRIRDLIDKKYTELGVPNVKEWRAQQAPLIEVKDQMSAAFKASEAAGDFKILDTVFKEAGWAAASWALGHPEVGAVKILYDVIRDVRKHRIKNVNLAAQRAIRKAIQEPAPIGAVKPGQPIGSAPTGKVFLTPEMNTALESMTKSMSLRQQIESIGDKFPEYKKRLQQELEKQQIEAEDLWNKIPMESEEPLARETGSLRRGPLPEAPPEIKEAMKDSRFEYIGSDDSGLSHFHDPETGNTFSQFTDRVTPEWIAKKVQQVESAAPAGKVRVELEIPKGRVPVYQSGEKKGQPWEPQTIRHHELTHLVFGDKHGIKFKSGVESHLHPENIGKNVTAAVTMDFSSMPGLINDRTGLFTQDGLKKYADAMIEMTIAGGVGQEIIDGIPITENVGLRGDIRWVKAVFERLDYTSEQARERLSLLEQNVRKDLQQKELTDIIKEYGAEREEGLPDTHHVSKERSEEMLERIRQLRIENEKRATEKPDDVTASAEETGRISRPVDASREEGSAGRPGPKVGLEVKPLPKQPKLPDEGTFPAIRTDDGGMYFTNKPGETHVQLAQRLGVPAERIIDGGYLKDGVYEESFRSDAGTYGEIARARMRADERKIRAKRRANSLVEQLTGKVGLETLPAKIVPEEIIDNKGKRWFKKDGEWVQYPRGVEAPKEKAGQTVKSRGIVSKGDKSDTKG